MMLSTITGMGGQKAKAIAAAYRNPAELVRAYAALPDNKLEDMLKDLAVGKGRLGPAMSAKVCQAFYR